MRNVFTRLQSGGSLNNAMLFRNDSHTIKIVVTEENQSLPTFRFVAKEMKEGADSTPWIIKSGADFTTTISIGGNQVISEFQLSPNDTTGFLGRKQIIYDIERTMNGTVSTIEQGSFTVVPDIAI